MLAGVTGRACQALAAGFLVMVLGACSGAIASPTPRRSASPTPLPTPTATPSPRPSNTPSPTPAPSLARSGDEVIALFRSEFGQAQPPFHLDTDVQVTGTVDGESGDLGLYIGGDVSGQDFSGQMSIAFEHTVLIILVDGAAYVRQSQRWRQMAGFAQTQPLNPFGLLETDDLAYAGTATIDGRPLHQLQTEKWIGGELQAEEFETIELESSLFDIYVDDEGIPVEARLDFTITGTTESGGAARLNYFVVYRFSRVGEPVTITAPI